MKLKKKLDEARDNLAEVKAAVESGEKGADDLSAAIDAFNDAKANMDAAADAEALLKSLGDGERDAAEDAAPVQAKSLGDHFVKCAEGKMDRNRKFAYTAPAYGEKGDPVVHVTPRGDHTYAETLRNIDPEIREGYREPLVMAGLFNQEPVTNGNSVTYFTENPDFEGDFLMVAENGKKPQISFGDPVEHNETLHKVAGYYKVSDEVLDDAPRLAAAIDRRALARRDEVEDSQLINGDGTGNNIKGVLNVSGLQTARYEHGGSIGPDVILDALAAVENATGFQADAIVMNPTDYNEMRKLKDGNGQYLAGGPFVGEYGNGTIVPKPAIWGTKVVTTSKMPQGTALVGAFKQGGTVFRKGGVQVSVYNQNEDDAIHNRVTIVVESRLTLGIEYPAAFVKIAEADE